MSILYDPSKLLKKIAPESKLKKLMTQKLTVKKAAFSFVDDIEFLNKKAVTETALKVAKSYNERAKREAKETDATKSQASRAIAKDPKLLVNRVQNEVIFQIKESIKSTYAGEFYKWLPSDADEPDPEHQLNYGKVFKVGDGEMPGDRIGCRCGMEILVNENELDL